MRIEYQEFYNDSIKDLNQYGSKGWKIVAISKTETRYDSWECRDINFYYGLMMRELTEEVTDDDSY